MMRFTAFFFVMDATSVNVAPHLSFVDGTRRKWWTIYCTQLLCVTAIEWWIIRSSTGWLARLFYGLCSTMEKCLFFFPPRVIARPWDNNVCIHHRVSPIWVCFFCPGGISMVLGGLIIANKLEPTMRCYQWRKWNQISGACSIIQKNPAKADLIRRANCIRFLPFYSVQLLW